jgi:hypothetical protein
MLIVPPSTWQLPGALPALRDATVAIDVECRDHGLQYERGRAGHYLVPATCAV